MTRIRVIRPGLLTSIQDRGRLGYEQWGISPAGVLDDYAAGWANWLVQNPADAAVLEVTGIGPELEVLEDGALSLAGADLSATVDGRPWPPGQAQTVKAGARVKFGRRRAGFRAYLGFPGGIAVPEVMGSRSTDLTGRFGGLHGRALAAGDELAALGPVTATRNTARTTLYRRAVVRVLPGVRLDRFGDAAWPRLLTSAYRVSPASSGVGLRLQGPLLDSPRGDWPSEGMAIGAVECPPSGNPLILLKGRGSIGGYPVIAHVIRADWPALAQLAPGETIRFVEVSRQEALYRLGAQRARLGRGGAPRSLEHTAPTQGMVRRRDAQDCQLPHVGDWLDRGEIVAWLDTRSGSLPLRVAQSGVLEDMVEEGARVTSGQRIWRVRMEEDDDYPTH